MRRSLPAAAALVLALGALGGCGDDEPEPAADQETETIEITVAEGTVEPNGEVVEVGVDQPIELVVTADAPGEIHVHTRPEEQEFEYAAGTTTLPLTIDKPGVVEVESHDPEQIIVKLEVE